MDYLIVLFKNKKRKKIINKFKTLDRAKLFFQKKIEESNSVVFEKSVENASPCDYELGLLSSSIEDFESYFIKDSLGRQIKVDIDSGYKVIDLKPFKVPESLYDVNLKTKITFEKFMNLYLKDKSIKLLSKLNNKVVLQNDSDVKLFSLKNEIESNRFLKELNDYLISENRMDCIIVNDTSKSQKKYLYDILSDMGLEKKLLYRRTTTFKPR